ncbi:BnaC05g00980D [Brassica napus]|uniref:BnaC05g00980D protein n=1 Tax=Brassica napus TaxID=3708 RepID=A0A078FQS5_BRANA|nr:BnaC05g00980D [Brassica napus]
MDLFKTNFFPKICNITEKRDNCYCYFLFLLYWNLGCLHSEFGFLVSCLYPIWILIPIVNFLYFSNLIR